MSLQTAKENYFKSVNDVQIGTQAKKSGSHQSSSKTVSFEYYLLNSVVFGNYYSLTASNGSPFDQTHISSAFLSLPEQPPENS
jgi:hypothetical protein